MVRARHMHVLDVNRHLPTPWIYGELVDEHYIVDQETGQEMLIDPSTKCEDAGYTAVWEDEKGAHTCQLYEGDVVTYKTDGFSISAVVKMIDDTPYLVSTELANDRIPLCTIADSSKHVFVEDVLSLDENFHSKNEYARYPDYVTRTVLQQKDMEDTPSDRYAVQRMTPNEVFESVCLWEGFINYADTIKSWIKDIYGVGLDE